MGGRTPLLNGVGRVSRRSYFALFRRTGRIGSSESYGLDLGVGHDRGLAVAGTAGTPFSWVLVTSAGMMSPVGR